MKKWANYIPILSLILTVITATGAATYQITKSLESVRSEVSALSVEVGSLWTNRDQALFVATSERNLLAAGVKVHVPSVSEIKRETITGSDF